MEFYYKNEREHRMSNTKNKNYYGFKQNKQENPYGRYTPGTVGKISIAVTVPSAIIAFVSVMIALLTPMIQALMVTLITFIISFVGSVILAIDIVIFNRKQSKKSGTSDQPKQLDIMRIVHLIVGIGVGIIIGYLIWGNK